MDVSKTERIKKDPEKTIATAKADEKRRFQEYIKLQRDKVEGGHKIAVTPKTLFIGEAKKYETVVKKVEKQSLMGAESAKERECSLSDGELDHVVPDSKN